MKTRICLKNRKCRDTTGNCLVRGSDGFPLQCVGPWAEDKHFYLKRYLEATREARNKYSRYGNAVYVDLFSGPGKSIIRDEQREILGGGLIATTLDQVPFNEYWFCDLLPNNIEALKNRIGSEKKGQYYVGDANVKITEMVSLLNQAPYDRYHFIFVDPFGLKALKFPTIAKLAELKRLDVLLNFPLMPMKRNIPQWLQDNGQEVALDEFLGTKEWREKIQTGTMEQQVTILLEIYRKQLLKAGFPENGIQIHKQISTVQIKNTKERCLYALVLFSKHPVAQKIWNSVIKKNPSGQSELPGL